MGNMIFNIDKKIMMNAWAVTTRIIQIKILILEVKFLILRWRASTRNFDFLGHN